MQIKAQTVIAPHNLITFNIKHTDTDTGQVLEGQFTSKRLAVRDKGQLKVRTAQLCGGMYCVRDDETGKPTGQGIDPETEFMNQMIAHLEIALIQKPMWFDLGSITDMSLIGEVYNRVLEHEVKFKSGEQGSGSSGVGTQNGSQQYSGTNTGNVITPLVGKEVQSTLD